MQDLILWVPNDAGWQVVMFWKPLNLSRCLTGEPEPELLFSNSVSPGAVTFSLGRLFWCPTMLWVNNLFLMSKVNLPWHSFIPFPQVPSLIIREKNGTVETYHKNSLYQVESSFFLNLSPTLGCSTADCSPIYAQEGFNLVVHSLQTLFPGGWDKDNSREPPPLALSNIHSSFLEGVLWHGTSLEECICVDIIN